MGMEVAQFLDNKQIYTSVITELELFGKPNLSFQDIENYYNDVRFKHLQNVKNR